MTVKDLARLPLRCRRGSVAKSFVHFIPARRNCLSLPVVPYVGLDSTASVYALRGTRWQFTLLW